MPALSLDVFRRYSLAILSVGLIVVVRLAFYPVLGSRYPFLFFFIAIVVTAGYGGYGPSLLATILSWLAIDYLFLVPRSSSTIFESRSQLAFGFFSAGLAVTVLGGFLDQPGSV